MAWEQETGLWHENQCMDIVRGHGLGCMTTRSWFWSRSVQSSAVCTGSGRGLML